MIIPKQITNSYEVAGFNNKRHLTSLGKFASQIGEGSRVLEIGVGWGGSTWELMDSLPENCELHSCDTFGGDDYHPAHPGCQQAIDEWSEVTGRPFSFDPYDTGSGFWYSVKEF